MDHVPHHRPDQHRRGPAVPRWSGVVLVAAVIASAVGTGALAVAASPLQLGSAAASRAPSPAEVTLKIRHPAKRSAGTVRRMAGPVVASTGPAPARAELRKAGPRDSRGVARNIARHLAAGNTEVARYVIPYQVYRTTGCRVGFMTATVDPAEEGAVEGEKQNRGPRLARARGSLGRDAVAHAAEPTIEGRKVHVIVAQLCPVRRGT
ncbi:MAG: hypothetical protein ACRDIX_00860 [Actinomycetota bacterium]